jgi:hypothetical protein
MIHYCKLFGFSPHKTQFAVALFQDIFKPITLPVNFGEQHRAGIVVCLHYSAPPDFTLTLEKMRKLIGVDGKCFLNALAKVLKSFTKFKNRYYKRRLYARAQARGRMPKFDRDSRLTKEVCGRDVTGELRAEIYLGSQG